MGYIRKKQIEKFDLDKLPEGMYSFSGNEGFVKVEVDRNGHQSWDLENWFSSLDPDANKDHREKIIKDIKKRLNVDTGIIDPPKKKTKEGFLSRLRI